MTHPFLAAFNRCEAMLKPSVARFGEVTMTDVLTAILAGRAQIWEGEGAVIVTQLVKTDQGGVIHGWLCGGKRQAILDLIPGVEAFGRAWGCVAATQEGREGWKRVMAPLGYSGDGPLLRKAL